VASDQFSYSFAASGGLFSPFAKDNQETVKGLLVAAQEWLSGGEQSSVLVNDCGVAPVDQAHLQRLRREFLLGRSY